MAEGHHASLLSDAHTWVLFSALIFATIAFIKGKKPILAMLDGRTARIKNELEEAEQLKKEAEILFKEYKKKYDEASQEASQIISEAKKYAELIQKKSEKTLEKQITRREELLLERITRAENNAVKELSDKAVDIAAEAAKQLLTEAMKDNGENIINKSINTLPKTIN